MTLLTDPSGSTTAQPQAYPGSKHGLLELAVVVAGAEVVSGLDDETGADEVGDSATDELEGASPSAETGAM
ncbi:MAG: hypothetical protein ACKOFZ_01955 [Ilumatobacteraceae bacterium]